MPTTTSITNLNQNGKRGLDSDLQNGRRVRFREKAQICETFQNGILDIDGENARQSTDFNDRNILDYAAKNRFWEYTPEQLTAIRTALTSPVSKDITVLFKTLDTLENNLTNPNAKRKYIELLSTNPQLRPRSMFWDPYRERIVGIDLKPSLRY